MNKEEREICELEDNFVSLIDKFIVSFPKLISGPKSYRDFRETDPRTKIAFTTLWTLIH